MKAESIIKSIGVTLMVFHSGCIMGTPIKATARFHVVVTDSDTGLPMENVHVQACFNSGGGWSGEFDGTDRDETFTDKDGKCTVSGSMNRPRGASAGVGDLPGYYPAGVAPTYTGSSFIKLNRWQPDGQTLHLALDKIGNPIPLFIHKEDLNRDLNGDADSWWPVETSFSYDFLKADWLPPLGKGEVADMTITRHKRNVLGVGMNPGLVKAEAFVDTMTVAFNGPDNGWIEMFPHENPGIKVRTAPESGYSREKKIWIKEDMNLVFTRSESEDRCQCFRIRTKRNEKGEIVESYYGKMYGDFHMTISRHYKTAGLRFSYYLNPTPNDRNLEWDQKTNLCKNPGELYRLRP